MSDLTSTERRILGKLAGAWNLYLELPVEHAADRGEFARIIHDAQARVMMRPTRRALRGE